MSNAIKARSYFATIHGTRPYRADLYIETNTWAEGDWTGDADVTGPIAEGDDFPTLKDAKAWIREQAGVPIEMGRADKAYWRGFVAIDPCCRKCGRPLEDGKCQDCGR